MIKSITVTNYLNESLTIDLSSPDNSGLAVVSIDGLGPAQANISTSDLASADGSLYNSARLGMRTITFQLKAVPNYENEKIDSNEKIRYRVYKYFPIKKECTITFKTDTREAYTKGYVDKNEPNIFGEKDSMSIEIVCPDPWFYSVASENTTFSGVKSTFAFPFSASKEDGLSLGDIYTNTVNNVYYSGDSETGIIMSIHAVGPATNIRIYNIITHERISFIDSVIESITGSKLIAGDDLIVSTMRGNKGIKLIRDGVTYNILNCINRNADWFQLSKGDNQFAFTADDDGVSSPLNLRFDILSTVVYEGV